MMSKLAICLPTYNRAEALCANLDRLADLASRHDFVVYVSDNCSTDHTGDVAIAAAERCRKIHYHRNQTNIGMDGNFAAVLGLPDTPYRWLLGDDDFISETALTDILALIETDDYDIMLVNGGSERRESGRVQDQPSRDFGDPERFLSELGWHATWISGLVIGRRLLESMRIEAHIGSYFSHFIAVFEALGALSNPRIRWYAPSAFFPSPHVTFSWGGRLLEIFVERWSSAVSALPSSYSQTAKSKCIRAHGVETGLLTFMGLCNIRAQGGLNLPLARQHREGLERCSPCPWWLIVTICTVPRRPLHIARSAALKVRASLAGR